MGRECHQIAEVLDGWLHVALGLDGVHGPLLRWGSEGENAKSSPKLAVRRLTVGALALELGGAPARLGELAQEDLDRHDAPEIERPGPPAHGTEPVEIDPFGDQRLAQQAVDLWPLGVQPALLDRVE